MPSPSTRKAEITSSRKAGPPSAFILIAVAASQYRTGALDESWAGLLQTESAAEHRGEHLAVVAARGLRALQAAVGRLGLHRIVRHEEEDVLLEVHTRDPRSVARRTGLL